MEKTMEKIKLLSPAGNFACLVAAVNNGADAVYFGSKLFNARRLADNFSDDELKKAIQYAHLHHVKVYFVLNTLIKNSEIKAFLNQVSLVESYGADALIIQDLSFAPLIKKHFPDLEIHASTQSTITNSYAVNYWKKYVDLFILARELSKEEIKDIYKKTKANLELFVHGHLCSSYSGQCLISSLIGSRSGNRGMCASSCRKRYVHNILQVEALQRTQPWSAREGMLVVLTTPRNGSSSCHTGPQRSSINEAGASKTLCTYRKQYNLSHKDFKSKDFNLKEYPEQNDHYLISAKDLSLIDDLQEVVESGVKTIKIEGRMKSPEYVAVTTRLYRKAIDNYYSGKKVCLSEQEKQDLKLAFNRDFTAGYFSGERSIIDPILSSKRGIYLGLVKNNLILLEHPIDWHDGITCLSKGQREGGFVKKIVSADGKELEHADKGMKVKLNISGFRNNARVFLSSQHQGRNILGAVKKLPISISLTITENSYPEIIIYVKDQQLKIRLKEKATPPKKFPLTKEDLVKEFAKYNSSYNNYSYNSNDFGYNLNIFNIDKLEIKTDNSFIPKSELTKFRQELDQKLLDLLLPVKEKKNISLPSFHKTAAEDNMCIASFRSKSLRKIQPCTINTTNDRIYVHKCDSFHIYCTPARGALRERSAHLDTKRGLRRCYAHTEDRKIYARIYSLEDARSALDAGADYVCYDAFTDKDELEKISKLAGDKFILYTPMAMHETDCEELLKIIKDVQPKQIMTNNVGVLGLKIEHKLDIPIILGPQMNVFNDHQLAHYGILAVASLELTAAELSKFFDKSKLIHYSHGRPAVMTFNEEISGNKLVDEKRYAFPLRKMHLSGRIKTEMLYSKTIATLQHLPLILEAGIGSIFLDINYHDNNDNNVYDLVKTYRKLLAGESISVSRFKKDTTLGNLKKGVM